MTASYIKNKKPSIKEDFLSVGVFLSLQVQELNLQELAPFQLVAAGC
jgi:hypothetical protein